MVHSSILWNDPDEMVILFDDPALVDWKETATKHVFEANLPELQEVDVRVEVNKHRIMGIGWQCPREVQKRDTRRRVELSTGEVMRKFRLPENANLEAITTKVDSGVLTVVVPKIDTRPREEFSTWEVMRMFRLLENANLDAITTKVDSGVLSVPKVEKTTPQTRSIAIAGQEATVPAIAQDDKKAAEATDDGAIAALKL